MEFVLGFFIGRELLSEVKEEGGGVFGDIYVVRFGDDGGFF